MVYVGDTIISLRPTKKAPSMIPIAALILELDLFREKVDERRCSGSAFFGFGPSCLLFFRNVVGIVHGGLYGYNLKSPTRNAFKPSFCTGFLVHSLLCTGLQW
jgi:hypothetical protein